MAFEFESRPSDSPVVQSVWRTSSGDVASFMSIAVSRSELVVMKRHGVTTVTYRGPETKASWADCPDDAEFFGIEFRLGAFVPAFPSGSLVDGAVDLPSTASRFELNASTLDLPDYDNADTFIEALRRRGLIERDSLVAAVSEGLPSGAAPRTVQRHFRHATGLTATAVRQIERARKAIRLLSRGHTIAAATEAAGYADQAHLTRHLRRFGGRTPLQLQRQPVAMSLQY